MKRFVYIIALVALTIAEIFIAFYMHDGLIRPYIGDMLVTMMLCCLVRCIFPNKPRMLALYVFLFSVAVELSQLLHIADKLGIHNGLLRIMMGSVFDPMDILCYFTGCIVFFLAEELLNNRLKS